MFTFIMYYNFNLFYVQSMVQRTKINHICK